MARPSDPKPKPTLVASSLVIRTLQAEYIKAKNRLESSEQRLASLDTQRDRESELVADYKRDMAELLAAIVAMGGREPPEPTAADFQNQMSGEPDRAPIGEAGVLRTGKPSPFPTEPSGG